MIFWKNSFFFPHLVVNNCYFTFWHLIDCIDWLNPKHESSMKLFFCKVNISGFVNIIQVTIGVYAREGLL